MSINFNEDIIRLITESSYSRKDEKLISELRKEIEKYNIHDFIARVSSLSLIMVNQNKSITINTAIGVALSINNNVTSSKANMSSKKFKDTILKFQDLSNYKLVDPPENPFIERIMFYENFFIFPGIYHNPAYTLQMIIKVINREHNILPAEFTKKFFSLVNLILVLSTNIAKRIVPNYNGLEIPIELESIEVPNSQIQSKILENILIDNKLFYELLDNDPDLINDLLYDFGKAKLKDALNTKSQDFFRRPFLRISSEKIAILDITVLASMVVHKTILLSKKYRIKETLFELYNNLVWYNVRKSIKMLDHERLDDKSFQIDLCDELNYKEAIFSIVDKKVLYAICIFDDGENYEDQDLFGTYRNSKQNKKLNSQIGKTVNKLIHNKIKKTDIIICLVFNSFGRMMANDLNHGYEDNTLVLYPSDLYFISINQYNQYWFIAKYLNSKIRLVEHTRSNYIGELNFIHVYVENDYSFYIQDNFDSSKDYLAISSSETLKYKLKALKTENRLIIESYDKDFYVEVVRYDDSTHTYISVESIEKIDFRFVAIFNNIKIWILCDSSNEETKQLSNNFIEVLLYWLNEAEELYNANLPMSEYLVINISISGDIDKYYNLFDTSKVLSETISFIRNENNVGVILTPETFYCLNCVDNSAEKELFTLLTREILNPLTITTKQFKLIEYIFHNKNKRKLFMLNTSKLGYFKDLTNKSFVKIHSADINNLLDDAGSYLVSLGNWNVGLIPNEKRTELIKDVVFYLFSSLESTISKITTINLIEAVYYNLERTSHMLLLKNKTFFHEVTCNPKKEKAIFDEINELNKLSISYKFLLEYLASISTQGDQFLDIFEYDRLLAISYLITDWGYKKDLFEFQMINTEIRILPSKRVGMRSDDFVSINNVFEEARISQLINLSLKEDKATLDKGKFVKIDDADNTQINDAFEDEFGFTFDQLNTVIWALVEIGEAQDKEVSKIEVSEFINIFERRNNITNVDNKDLMKIIDFLSLKQRDSFLNPNPPFEVYDVYPWRFNRELSFTKRPVIVKDNVLIWGNRSLTSMLFFTLDMLNSGKFKAKKQKLKLLKSKISKLNGVEFNNEIFEILKTYTGLQVYKNVSKINSKKLKDSMGLDLGDIDILCIHKSKKRIILIETKNFNFSRNPYEIYSEYLKMFVDKDNKKSFSTKHKRREEWINENIEEVYTEYGICDINYKVSRMFILSDYLVSNDIYRTNEKIITKSELTLLKLLSKT